MRTLLWKQNAKNDEFQALGVEIKRYENDVRSLEDQELDRLSKRMSKMTVCAAASVARKEREGYWNPS